MLRTAKYFGVQQNILKCEKSCRIEMNFHSTFKRKYRNCRAENKLYIVIPLVYWMTGSKEIQKVKICTNKPI